MSLIPLSLFHVKTENTLVCSYNMHALYLDTSKRSTEEEAFIAGQGAHWVIVSLEGGQKLKGLIVPHLDGVVR